MTPEIESLVQQLIEAAPDVPTSWCPLLSIEERRSLDRWRSLANPANITAVILAFQEELKQLKARTYLNVKDAVKEATDEARENTATEISAILDKSHAEELKQARRDAWWNDFRPIIDAIGEISVQEAMTAIERNL